MLDTLDDKAFTAEEKVANARHFMNKALEQQARADSYSHMADAEGVSGFQVKKMQSSAWY